MNTIIIDFDRSKKIYAIKAIRQVTGLGLKEAKDIIDAVEQIEPQVLRFTLNETQRAALRSAGIIISDNPALQITDIYGTMRVLISLLLDKKSFKAAQCIIDALEIFDEEEF